MAGFFRRAQLGASAHPFRVLVGIYGTYAALWVPLEPALALLPSGELIASQGGIILAALLIASTVISVLRSTAPSEVSLNVNGVVNKVRVFHGDLFSLDGNLALPVNEFFDSEIGSSVSLESLHGQCIQRLYAGVSKDFEIAVDDALKAVASEEVAGRARRTKKYPIGTVAVLPLAGRKLFLVALSRTDGKSGNASASLEDYTRATLGLWRAISAHADGRLTTVPLFGGGLSRVPLRPFELLRGLVASLGVVGREASIAAPIRIVLREERSQAVNLSVLKDDYT